MVGLDAESFASHYDRYILRKSLAFALLVIGYMFRVAEANNACSLGFEGSLKNYTKDGDIIIGGILQLLYFQHDLTPGEMEMPSSIECVLNYPRYLRHFLAIHFATVEINQNSNLLPNLTLGYDVYDICNSDIGAIEGMFKIFSGTQKMYPNYICRKNSTLIGLVGHLQSSPSLTMANLLQLYHYPQISYGATDIALSDRTKYPFFFRTAPTYLMQNAAIVQLLKQFGWNWVGIVTTVDDSKARAAEALREDIISSGGCVEYLFKESLKTSDWKHPFHTVVSKSTAQVLITYCNHEFVLDLLSGITNIKVLIITDGATIFQRNMFVDVSRLNGSLLILPSHHIIPNFKQFLLSISASDYPDSYVMYYMWTMQFDCSPWENEIIADPCHYMEHLSIFNKYDYDVENFRLTFRVYTAVYSLAHALHNMLSALNYHGRSSSVSAHNINPKKLIKYIKTVQFKTTGGDDVFFDHQGNFPSPLDVTSWVIYSNRSSIMKTVGHFHSESSSPGGSQLIINRSSVTFAQHISRNKKFVCSEDCLPGYRKINRGEPICCFSCIPCSIGEISNLTDMKNCISCPDDEWPDEKKSNCIKKHINFLSYKDYLGLAIEILSVFFFTVTLVVLVIFIIYRDTPIVKANNRILSYIILVNLQMSFLCPFLYIGQPTMITCAMRQVAFSMFFTAVISSVIAKTLIVLLAFHSTTPGSWLRSWTGKQTSVYIVLFCSSIEVIICMWSLIWNTPYPFKDTKSEMETIILTCDDGSGIAFYVIHGYILFLAMFSFVLAFLVRKLPDRFNEAHYITFSMLVFCSVWIAFIPTYLSIKGKYLVAVEVFAIMASSAGLLCCIFLSKCYKVLINHQINSKIQLFKVPQSKNI